MKELTKEWIDKAGMSLNWQMWSDKTVKEAISMRPQEMKGKEMEKGRSKSNSTRAGAAVLVALVFALFAAAPPAIAGTVTYDYDDAGRLVEADYGDGTAIEYVYDDAGNLLEQKITGGEGPTPPAPTVIKPNGGEEIPGGSVYDIKWSVTKGTHDLAANPITIWYSTNQRGKLDGYRNE